MVERAAKATTMLGTHGEGGPHVADAGAKNTMPKIALITSTKTFVANVAKQEASKEAKEERKEEKVSKESVGAVDW